MAGPKVTVIGEGICFFEKPILHKMVTSEVMSGGTLALMDIDMTSGYILKILYLEMVQLLLCKAVR